MTERDNTPRAHYLMREEVGDVLISTIDMLELSQGDVELLACMGYRYETMVFGGAYDQEQARYRHEDEARIGHAAMVAKVKGAA